jgi:uncharacterized protein related to proFAR isomerase
MEIVPVIDLKGGAVVRAERGERASYRPIATKLSATAAFPSLALWVDNGCADAASACYFLDRNAGDHLVLGSESLRDATILEELRGEPRVLLSLDFRGEAFQGPPDLLDRPQLWPDRVIAMTLARVGSGEGPDRARLSDIQTFAGPRRVYAAGGVRNTDDLRALARDGIAGALVASALHDGRLGADDLAALAM